MRAASCVSGYVAKFNSIVSASESALKAGKHAFLETLYGVVDQPNKSKEDVEREIWRRLGEAINTLPDLRSMRSSDEEYMRSLAATTEE